MIVFTDWRRMADLGCMGSMTGLRPASCVAWVRTRPGTGGLLRAKLGPGPIAARGVPDAVDRAAIRNVIETEDVVVADYPAKRRHPVREARGRVRAHPGPGVPTRRCHFGPVRRIRHLPRRRGEAGPGLAGLRHRPAVP